MARKNRGFVWCLALVLAAGCGGKSRKEWEAGAQHNSDANAAGAAATISPDCPFATLDLSSGIETCDDAEANPSVSFVHRARVGEGCSFDPKLADTCNVSECPGAHPVCDYKDGQAVCGTGCLTDAECGDREFCSCQGPGLGGRCVFSECVTDAGCATGQLCAALDNPCGLAGPFACQDSDDQCLVSSQCPTPGDQCVPIPQGGAGWLRICVSPTICPAP